MKRLAQLLFILLISLTGLCTNAQQIRVMSYNIRYANKSDKGNLWCSRKQAVVSMLRKYEPQIVGSQEGLHKQVKYINRKLRQYEMAGHGRNNGKTKGEYAAVFFNKDMFELLETRTFWLSETPDVPGSKGWDADATRIVTWCRLKVRSTGKILYVFNTHFDHAGAEARKYSAVLLRQQIIAIAGNEDVVLTGDMNAYPEDIPYRILASEENGYLLTDAAQGDNDGTFCGFRVAGASCKRIDYIFCSRNVKPVSYKVIDDHNGTSYPSDHKPVLAEVLLHKP
jgi:endonuclease/exonuclease/phosphatase family metal-dependent hydrolase